MEAARTAAENAALKVKSLFDLVADEAEKPSFDDCSFAVEGLKLFGAACRDNQLSISAEISTNLHLTRLRWIKKSDREFDSISMYLASTVNNPVYKNYGDC